MSSSAATACNTVTQDEEQLSPSARCMAEELFPSQNEYRKFSKEDKAILAKRKEEWSRGLSMESVVFSDDLSSIKEISGRPIEQFVGKMLIQFCRGNGIHVPNNEQSKVNCIKNIIAYKKGDSARGKVQKQSKEDRVMELNKQH